jgi:hypothetical protein
MLSRIKNRLIGCGLLALIHDELTARTHQNLNFWGGGGGGGLRQTSRHTRIEKICRSKEKAEFQMYF